MALVTVVEAVDGNEIGAPDAEIAALHAAPVVAPAMTPASVGQRREFQGPRAARAESAGEPAPTPPAGPARQPSPGLGARQPAPLAGDETGRLRKFSVPRHEIRQHETIAVDKDEIVAPALADGEIPRATRTETALLLPDMAQRERQLLTQRRDHARGRGGRTVVGDHRLEPEVRLPRQRTQREAESVRRLEGGDDDRQGRAGTRRDTGHAPRHFASNSHTSRKPSASLNAWNSLSGPAFTLEPSRLSTP